MGRRRFRSMSTSGTIVAKRSGRTACRRMSVQNPLVQPYAPWSQRDRVAREIARRGGAFTASHREDVGAVMPFQGRAVEARSIHEAVDVKHRHEPRTSSSAESLARMLRI